MRDGRCLFRPTEDRVKGADVVTRPVRRRTLREWTESGRKPLEMSRICEPVLTVDTRRRSLEGSGTDVNEPVEVGPHYG